MLTEVVDGRQDRCLVQRAVFIAVAEDATADGAAQVTWNQHVGWRIGGVVAVTIFLVAQADFQAVFVAVSAQ
ncbi:hypothetical protein D3C81_1974210 [compost metagenome]